MKEPVCKIEDYIAAIPEDRKDSFLKLRNSIKKNLPKGFVEEMNYGMIGYVVPHHLYPKGYHCNPKLPLPFINIACQKNFIAVYHMGIYADRQLLEWFQESFSKVCASKLDMGKSCIRFKKPEEIPFELIAELVKKISVKEWIEIYEEKFNKSENQRGKNK